MDVYASWQQVDITFSEKYFFFMLICRLGDVEIRAGSLAYWKQNRIPLLSTAEVRKILLNNLAFIIFSLLCPHTSYALRHKHVIFNAIFDAAYSCVSLRILEHASCSRVGRSHQSMLFARRPDLAVHPRSFDPVQLLLIGSSSRGCPCHMFKGQLLENCSTTHSRTEFYWFNLRLTSTPLPKHRSKMAVYKWRNQRAIIISWRANRKAVRNKN